MQSRIKGNSHGPGDRIQAKSNDTEASSKQQLSALQIQPQLPREVWQIIFDSMPIRDKLSSSKIFIEFGEFYSQQLKNFEKYAAGFRNNEVEKSAIAGTKRKHNNSADGLQTPSISFSIYLSKRSVIWLDPDKTSHRYLTFENDDVDIENHGYSTYLKVNRVCWLHFSVKEICLPTGKYNSLYKVKGPCRVENKFQITVKHSVPIGNDIGYINVKQLKSLDADWDWAPVYKNQDFKELLQVSYNFESHDVLDVELINVFNHWTTGLSFHVIRFQLAH